MIRTLVGAFGMFAALMIAFSIPAGYGLVRYNTEIEGLALKAKINGRKMEHFVEQDPGMWQFRSRQWPPLLELTGDPRDDVRQRLYNLAGIKLMDTGQELAWPVLSRTSPFIVDGSEAGHIETASSLRPVLIETALAGLVGGVLGFLAFFGFRTVPLRVLDRTIAELKRSRRDAEAIQARLTEAVEAMEDGFVLFDAEDRLVVCNSAYRRLHPHLEHVVEPGKTFEEIVRANVASGQVSEAAGSEEAWIAERIERWRRSERGELVMRQGERWMLHRDRRTPFGEMVCIRTDVTLLKENEAELKRAEEEAQAAQARLVAAVEAMDEGFVIYDAEDRLVLCNEAFRDIHREVRHMIEPGRTFEEITRAAAATGLWADAVGREEEWIAERVARRQQGDRSQIIHLSDGRWIMQRDRRTPDGEMV
ncbi:MAG TPA: PAS-domain containing protein, partial [Afifellaceae bacterium]|nr:PAS-domain containing protein [Afifellaceae bacterium]